jgi:hypothetical protein
MTIVHHVEQNYYAYPVRMTTLSANAKYVVGDDICVYMKKDGTNESKQNIDISAEQSSLERIYNDSIIGTCYNTQIQVQIQKPIS